MSLQDQMLFKIVDQRITDGYRITAGIVGIKIIALYWLVAVLITSQDKALYSFVAAFRDQKIRATEASYWFFGRAKSSLIAVNISQKH